MNAADIEIIKPTPLSRGNGRPSLTVIGDNKISLNATALTLLGIEKAKGGFVGFGRHATSREFYIIPHPKKQSDSFVVQTGGKITDLILPAQIAAHFNMPADEKGRRVYIHPVPVNAGGINMYWITA